MHKTTKNTILLAFIMLALSACKTDITSLISDLNLTAFTVRMTDGPTDVDEVNIDLELVVIKGENEWDTLEMRTYSGIYNLLDYQNGLDTVIGRVVTTFDYIKEIRLVLGDTNFIVAQEDTFDLKIPSGSQSGLKIKTCIDLRDVDEYELIIDFDAEASLHQTGNGRYQLKPVIRPLNPDAQCGGDGGDDDGDDDDDDDGDDDDDEGEIDYDTLPEAVSAYFEDNFSNWRPDRVSLGVLCDETEVYYVTGKARNERIIAAFELDGTWRETGIEIALRDLPSDIEEAIAEDYEIETAYKIERVEEDERYRVEVSNGEEEKILIYEENGTLDCLL